MKNFPTLFLNLASEQISGGSIIDINEAPWQIGIQNVDGTKYYCGGAIIHDTWILTKKRCLTPDGNNPIAIHVGSPFKLGGGQVIQVAESIPHPVCNSSILLFLLISFDEIGFIRNVLCLLT